MRVMVFVKATKDSETGVMPEYEMFEAMGRYNDELVAAGILKTANVMASNLLRRLHALRSMVTGAR